MSPNTYRTDCSQQPPAFLLATLGRSVLLVGFVEALLSGGCG